MRRLNLEEMLLDAIHAGRSFLTVEGHALTRAFPSAQTSDLQAVTQMKSASGRSDDDDG